MPMSLPLDARLPEEQVKHARQALARAKAVGEEYSGVYVATATVRTRRAGYAIVEEARRRGVEAIVLGAEEPSRIRGGAGLGGRGGPLENFVGEITKYVVSKADCRVIVTAPAPPRGSPQRQSPTQPRGSRQAERPPSSNLPRPCRSDARPRLMFVLIVGAGRVGSAVAKSALPPGTKSPCWTTTRSRTSAWTPGRARAGRTPGPVHGRHGARDRRADRGRDRARRRVHRLDRRR